MKINSDGSYETGYWHKKEDYPDQTVYIIDESTEQGRELAAKVIQYYPYTRFTVIDGYVVGVEQRDKTPEEIEKENAPKPKTQLEIVEEKLSLITAMLGDLILEGGL